MGVCVCVCFFSGFKVSQVKFMARCFDAACTFVTVQMRCARQTASGKLREASLCEAN